MRKVILTRRQDEELKALINIGLENGGNEREIKGTLLERHIRDGWEGTPAESLKTLTSAQFGEALFGNYEIKAEKFKLQKYAVEFKLNKFNTLKTLVVKYDIEEMTRNEIKDEAIKFANNLLKDKLDNDSVINIETLEKVLADKEMDEKENNEDNDENNE